MSASIATLALKALENFLLDLFIIHWLKLVLIVQLNQWSYIQGVLYSDIFDLIRGQFPGVSVANDEVIIRGASSINMSSEALYVVDGIITNDISWISPGDVKTIDIIKDSQASFYGSRGANGVVVIELRRGGD